MSPEREKEIEKILLEALEHEGEPSELEKVDPLEREQVRDWLATARALHELGRGERAALARVPKAEPSREHFALARAFLEEHRPRRKRIPLTLRLVAVVLLALGAALVLRFAWSESEPERFLLGAPPLELVEPVGEVESFGTFRWRGIPLPPNGGYRLVVESKGRELLRIDGLTQPSHTLEASAQARLDAIGQITWSVSVTSGDDAGSLLAWGSTEASRRSP